MRTLAELVDTREPGWPLVEQMIEAATNRVEVLPAEPEDGARALVGIQVTTRSPMGAMAYRTGGLLVDHGWMRILGAGSARLPRDLARWNFPSGLPHAPRLPGAFLVADDVLGGFFAMNGGAFEGPMGNVFYFAPDTLVWEDLGRGYTDFLEFVFLGDLAKFYEGSRWAGWEEEVHRLSGDHAFSFHPFLFAASEGGIEGRSRRAVAIEELWNLHANDHRAQR
ncbi:ABC-type sugar transport system, periplasmic component [Labilithrix luteola]|uniref:ABC-type sugar transport system, periplasmic component n=1 Tax=Labilithrix luteola TaxID=1391654 RepID=A0A0K1PXT3_9BACT|nr:DUF2625 domain-containing protein [Labilithrix luteola]AKU98317.1 ABC-type sugar transport system, periplasmic component [Labilithrix luteola]